MDSQQQEGLCLPTTQSANESKQGTHWTADQDNELRNYVANKKLSYSAIGAALGRTKNAVIGRAHRLGLYGFKRKQIERRGGVIISRLVRPPPPEHDEEQRPRLTANTDNRPRLNHCTLLDLTSQTCRWPYGHPGTTAFCFCGAKPSAKAPYCRTHCKIAYVSKTSRR